jgi:hypothetical protein
MYFKRASIVKGHGIPGMPQKMAITTTASSPGKLCRKLGNVLHIDIFLFIFSITIGHVSFETQTKIFEISPHSLPLPNGERGRVRGFCYLSRQISR